MEQKDGRKLFGFAEGNAFYNDPNASPDDAAAHMSKLDRQSRRVVSIGACILLALVLVVFIWAETYARADAEAVALVEQSRQVEVWFNNRIALGSGEASVGVMFYPAARVEETAYLPLFSRIAGDDVLCLIAGMPFHLATLDPEACEEIMERYPQVEHWYIAGHGMGGAVAAQYVAEHPGVFEGIVLLAAYPDSEPAVPVLTLYGDLDGVLDRAAYAAAPWGAQTEERVLAGGNHAQFGNYGTQRGDGAAALSAAAQQEQTAQAILAFIGQ